MAQYNKVNLKSLYDSVFANNTTGDISEEDLRNYVRDMLDSVISNVDNLQTLTTATSTNTYAISGGISSYANTYAVIVKFTNASTGASTLNVNSLGAKKIYTSPTSQAGNGDITANGIYLLVYDSALDSGTGGFLIVGGVGGGGGGSGTVSSGTQYRLAYYAATGTVVSEAGSITASKALKSDANGVPTHFDTATEPSLAELAHVKGVTSSIQDQINSTKYWITVPGTPTRTGNYTFTITDTANANLYNRLLTRTTVLKWTDSGNTKMAMVVSATYATDTVTVTTIGDILNVGFTSMKYAIEKADVVTFAYAGTLAAVTNISKKWKARTETKVFGADALHGTAGTTNATTYDVNKNGTTIFATKISVASGATVGNGYTADDGTTLALDDVLSLDCDSVSTTQPVDAYIDVFIFPLYSQYLT